MSSPEDIRPVVGYAFVEWVCLLGSGERRVTSDHDEENDCCSEKVDFSTLIWLSEMNLWSHIVVSTKLCMEIALSVTSLNWSSKTKVSNFQIKVFI